MDRFTDFVKRGFKSSGGTFEDVGKHTASNDYGGKDDGRPISFVREDLSEGHVAGDEIPASNRLAFAVKSAPNFHDLLVIVTDYDEDTKRDRKWNEERDRKEALDRAREEKERQEKEDNRTDRDRASERQKEQKQREALEKELRKKKLDGDELRHEVDRRVAEGKGKKLQTEQEKREAERSAARKEAYTKEVGTMMENAVEIPVTPCRPSMAAAFRVGDKIQTHSSMKGKGEPSRHPVVQQVLDKMGWVEHHAHNGSVIKHQKVHSSVGKLENWHGHCAEVGAVSDYLYFIDPYGKRTLEEAKAHFRSHDQGCMSVAHRPELSDGTKATELTAMVGPCGSCTFMLDELGISYHKPSDGVKQRRPRRGL